MSSRPVVALAASLALAASAGRAGASEPDAGGGAFPVIVISREQLLTSGKPTVGDYLQWLPMQGDALNAQTFDQGSGAVTVNLRAIGSERTLVLVDGRRMVPGGGLLATTQQVDLYAIPLFMVERIEILDGVGSTAAGSEAVAGVVNVITRRGLVGTEVAASGGISDRRDAATVDVSAFTGDRGERGGWVLGAGYARQDGLLAGDRGWSHTTYLYDRTGQTYPSRGSPFTPAGTMYLDPATCSTAACAALLAGYGAGTRLWTIDPAAPGGARPYQPADAYDATPRRTLSMPSERFGASAAGDVALGLGATGFLEASFTNRRSSQQLPPVALALNASNSPYVSAQSAYNPYGVDLPALYRRVEELGPLGTADDVGTFRAVAGLRGTLPEAFGSLAGWRWDAAFGYGRTAGTSERTGDLRTYDLAAGLGPSFVDPYGGEVRCGTPAQPISGCTPLDLFHGPLPADQVAAIGYTGVSRSAVQLRALTAGLQGALPAPQPGHPASLAVGLELRDQAAAFTPDSIAAAHDSYASFPYQAISGRYAEQALHAELLLPIWSGAPGFDRLDVALGGRLYHLSTSGAGATWLLGVRYAPLAGLTVRVGAATSYRAPSIEELYRPKRFDFPAVLDPCSGSSATGPLDPTSGLYAQCNATGVAQGAAPGPTANNGDSRVKLPAQLGGNPELAPETARRIGVGAVVVLVPGLSVSLDWSALRVEHVVNPRDGETLLRDCYTASPDPGTAATASSPQRYCDAIRRTSSGLIEVMDTLLQNDGTIAVSALDLAASYALPTGAGRFGLALDGTWVFTHDVTSPGGQVGQRAGYGDEIAANPHLKLAARATWALGPLGAGVGLRWVGSYQECFNYGCRPDHGTGAPSATRTVPAWTPLDLHARWEPVTGWGTTTVVLGLNNVLDEDPPMSALGYHPADPSSYDFQGRQWFLRLAQDF